MTQLDVFAEQTPSEAFARRFAAQPNFQGFSGLNRLQNQAFNTAGRQAVSQLPFSQAFSLFGGGGLLPQFQGASATDIGQAVPGRDEAFDAFLGSNTRASSGQLQDRLSSAVSSLNANQASVLGQQGAAPLSPALSLLLSEVGGSPDTAASLSVAPFIQGLPPALRGAVLNTILGRFGDFQTTQPQNNFLDTFNRFQGAGFF